MRWASILLLFWPLLAMSLPDDWAPSFALPEGLRWDNLEGGDEWLAGPRPERVDGLHEVSLRADDALKLRLPGGAYLRLTATDDQPLSIGDFAIEHSNGSGLFVDDQLMPLADGGLLLSPFSEEAGVVRLRRVSRRPDRQRIALFLSRKLSPPSILAYREAIQLPLDSIELVSGRQRERQLLYRLVAGQPTEIELEGPLRLRIDSRMVYPQEAGPVLADYRIQFGLDDRPPESLEISSGPEYRYPAVAEGRVLSVTRTHNDYLQIPEGEHRLVLSSDQPLLLRLLAMGPDDYLLPDLNAPEGVLDAFESTAPPYDVAQSDLARQALALARDTHTQPNASLAIEQLRRDEKRFPQLRGARRALEGDYLFWRDLLPVGPHEGAGLYHFPTPRLLRPGEARAVHLDSHHHRDLMKQLPDGHFFRMAGGDGKDFVVPSRFAPSQLRLILASGSLKESVELKLELEGGQAHRLRFDPETLPSAQDFQLEPVQVALGHPRRRGRPRRFFSSC